MSGYQAEKREELSLLKLVITVAFEGFWAKIVVIVI